jgi:hypothetical protein
MRRTGPAGTRTSFCFWPCTSGSASPIQRSPRCRVSALRCGVILLRSLRPAPARIRATVPTVAWSFGFFIIFAIVFAA